MKSVYREDSSESFHFVQSDEIAPTFHPADGNYYTSKAKIREVTRAHGLIEAGNESIRGLKPEKKDISARQIAEAANYAREHLRDPRNLRAYRERQRERLGELRGIGLSDE